ncbi:MAG TPA: N-acetylmuramoyl-L-alanine amidase [Candidatus Dormibacteraeota bacterium]|nr:N-acetylmuramoyl-L-alanine amidase [Candidatus Dormibacteraeota bacterium]
MRRTAARLLHIFPGAVILASMVTLSAVPQGVAAAAPPPAPYVIAIDPGHGGSPDNSRPDQLFDPGSIAINGLAEKNLTLDLARRVQKRLQADEVKVIMTRTADQYLGIPERMTAASNAGAQLFVSLHFNFFQDPKVSGSVILYPRDSDRPFAQLMSDTLARNLAPFHVTDGGVMLRDNLWAHAPMPAITVESAYLTNKREAGLLTGDRFKNAIAAAVTTGIETQVRGVQARKAEIVKYRLAAARAAASAHQVAVVKGPSLPPIRFVQVALLLAVGALVVRFRRGLIPVIAFGIAIVTVLRARARGREPEWRTRRGVRRRRSRAPIWSEARTH